MDNPRFLSLGGGHPRHFSYSGGNLVNCMGHAKLYVYLLLFMHVVGGGAALWWWRRRPAGAAAQQGKNDETRDPESG